MKGLNIRNVLHSGEVVRYHNHAGVDKQKNSEHQWAAALIVQYLYPNCSKELLLAALTHDCAEYYTGDIPFPVKQDSPELKEMLDRLESKWESDNGLQWLHGLSSLEKDTLKIADTLEGMRFCILQVRLGHTSAKRPFRKWRTVIQNNYSHRFTNLCGFEEYFKNLCQEMEKL